MIHRPGATLSAGSQTVLPTVGFSLATTAEFIAAAHRRGAVFYVVGWPCLLVSEVSRFFVVFGRYWPQIWPHVSLPNGHFARQSAKATIGSRACRLALARASPD